MEYGICQLGIVPARAEASDKAEIVTQLLFGEHFQVLEQHEKWLRIKTHHDNYEAWICQKQWQEITHEDYDNLSINEFPVVADQWGHATNIETGESVPVSAGAILPYYQNGRCRLRNVEYKFEGSIATKKAADLERYAKSFLNTPYLWGGRGPLGIDCSGFAQLVFRLTGRSLPRDAYQQAELGDTIQFTELAECGDLVFFDNEEGRINHVAIVLQPGFAIHASGKVRIDQLDHQGLFATDQQKYTHKLRIIKRIS